MTTDLDKARALVPFLNTAQSATREQLESLSTQAADTLASLIDDVERARTALVECQEEIDHYIRHEYPFDNPVHERCRKRDFSANPARRILAALNLQEGK